MVRRATPIAATIAIGFDHVPRLNGPFSVHVLPSAKNPAITGIMYEIYRKTAQPVARTRNGSTFNLNIIPRDPTSVERNAKVSPVQMAYAVVRIWDLI